MAWALAPPAGAPPTESFPSAPLLIGTVSPAQTLSSLLLFLAYAAVYALVVHPISAVWVVLLFLAIHQIEGHIVVPNVMGNALRLHPLLVIFGLAAGAELYGLPGALIALPLLAVGRAIWEFFADRVTLEAWSEQEPVPVELVEPRTIEKS